MTRDSDPYRTLARVIVEGDAARVPAPSMAQRAHVAGLTTYLRHGSGHMAAIGAAGQDGLNARLAREAGLDPAAPDYEKRLAAARSLYFSSIRRRPR